MRYFLMAINAVPPVLAVIGFIRAWPINWLMLFAVASLMLGIGTLILTSVWVA